MAISTSRDELLQFLDERVFAPTLAADPLAYESAENRKLLKSVKRRVHETKVRYFAHYASAPEIKANFVQDLNSKPGQALAADMWILKLVRFEDVRTEFLALCKQLAL